MIKRRQALVDLVNLRGEVTMNDLRGMFPGVSEVTLRKDLRILDEENKLVRVHGGAKSLQDIIHGGTNYAFRTSLHQEEKTVIAKKAAALFHQGCSMYISSGTTCSEFARHLPEEVSYVFTDGIGVAFNLPYSTSRYCELLGGRLNQNLMRITGTSVISSLEKLHLDYAVLGATGFHPDYGIPQGTHLLSSVAQAAIASADKVIVLMDSSKVNYIRSPWNIPLSDIDIIVSDDALPKNIRKIMEENGIEVY